MHLDKCLETGDWKSIRIELENRPSEGINGSAEGKAILDILVKFGVLQKHSAVTFSLWRTGKPRWEFLHADDLADACIYLMEAINFDDIVQDDTSQVKNTQINIGIGKDLSIKELAFIINGMTGFDGQFFWDTSEPDGTVQKFLDVCKIRNLGWKESIALENGIGKVYGSYTSNQS